MFALKTATILYFATICFGGPIGDETTPSLKLRLNLCPVSQRELDEYCSEAAKAIKVSYQNITSTDCSVKKIKGEKRSEGKILTCLYDGSERRFFGNRNTLNEIMEYGCEPCDAKTGCCSVNQNQKAWDRMVNDVKNRAKQCRERYDHNVRDKMTAKNKIILPAEYENWPRYYVSDEEVTDGISYDSMDKYIF